jgi:hypothetical protein
MFYDHFRLYWSFELNSVRETVKLFRHVYTVISRDDSLNPGGHLRSLSIDCVLGKGGRSWRGAATIVTSFNLD